jgi:hypothetical protein
MTRHRWTHIAAVAALAGGAAWTVKFLVVFASDAEAEVAAGVLYVAAVLLLVVGSTWVGTRLAGNGPRLLLALLVVASPALWWASYMVLDAAAKAVVGDAGPAWLEDEAGVLATGLAWLALGVYAVRAQPARRAAPAA